MYITRYFVNINLLGEFHQMYIFEMKQNMIDDWLIDNFGALWDKYEVTKSWGQKVKAQALRISFG